MTPKSAAYNYQLTDPVGRSSQTIAVRRKFVHYSPEMAAEVCRLISEGKTITWIERQPDLPGRHAVLDWRRDNPDFAKAYQQALEMRYEMWADDLISIADDAVNDTYLDAKGDVKVDYENVQRSRLRCDMRKWLLTKLCGQKFGDVSRQEITGANGSPVTFVMKLAPPETP